jgi:hypothetical protein
MRTLATLSLLLAVLAGCRSPSAEPAERGIGEMWVGAAVRDASLHKAILVQRTLFPYHFEPGSAELNDLGRGDLAILAAQLGRGSGPGQLGVRRGGAPEELYKARVERVLDALAEAGVPRGHVAIADALPGGEGADSERVRTVLSAPTLPFLGSDGASASGQGSILQSQGSHP